MSSQKVTDRWVKQGEKKPGAQNNVLLVYVDFPRIQIIQLNESHILQQLVFVLIWSLELDKSEKCLPSSSLRFHPTNSESLLAPAVAEALN